MNAICASARFWFPFRRPHAGAKSKGLKPEISTLRSGNLPEKVPKKRSSSTGRVHAAQHTRGPGYSPCAWAAKLGRLQKGEPGRRRLSLPGLLGPHPSVQARGLLLPGLRPLPAPRLQPGRRPRGRRCHSGPRAAAAAPVGGDRAAPEAPRPQPAPSPGAPAPRLGCFLSASGGGEPASRAG